jgi:hypothetical protein
VSLNSSADIETTTGNVTVASSNFGGTGNGISTTSGTVMVSDSTFDSGLNNGISAGSNVTVTGSTFNNTIATAITATSNVTVDSSTFSGNGTALSVSSTTVSITDSLFTNSGSDAVDVGNDLTVTGSTFSNNHNGNGITVDGSDLTVSSSAFIGNEYGISVGTEPDDEVVPAITTVASGASVTGSTFSSNLAGIASAAALTVDSSSFIGDEYGIVTGEAPAGVVSAVVPAQDEGVVALTVTNSTFNGNASDGIEAEGSLNASTSVFSGNDTGIEATGGGVVSNSTIYGNGTGLLIPGGTVTFTTIAGNVNAGISGADGGTLTIGNTILSNNGVGSNFIDMGQITSLGHNISGDDSGASGLTGPGDLNNTNPIIGPLTDNGGPTLTCALLTGSPALGAASSTSAPPTDQRGVPRPTGGGDIGAFQTEGTTTTVTPSANPSLVGQSVTFTAVVSASAGIGTPTGDVTFTIDGQAQTPVALTTVDGMQEATLMTSSLTVGAHTIGASYGGATGFAGSPATPFTQQVNVGTSTSLIPPTGPVIAGQPVTFTAVVTPTTDPPALPGDVTFTIDGQAQTPVPLTLVNGVNQATITISTLSFGSHTIGATYSGGTGFSSSPAAPITLQVKVAPDVVSLQRYGLHAQPTVLVLTFNTAMDPNPAEDTNNYLITTYFGPGRLGRAGRGIIPVDNAVYNASTDQVSLDLSQRLGLHRTYALTVNGTPPDGLTSAVGVPLAGDGINAGTNYETLISKDALWGPAGQAPVVSVRHPAPRPRVSAAAVDALAASDRLGLAHLTADNRSVASRHRG